MRTMLGNYTDASEKKYTVKVKTVGYAYQTDKDSPERIQLLRVLYIPKFDSFGFCGTIPKKLMKAFNGRPATTATIENLEKREIYSVGQWEVAFEEYEGLRDRKEEIRQKILSKNLIK